MGNIREMNRSEQRATAADSADSRFWNRSVARRGLRDARSAGCPLPGARGRGLEQALDFAGDPSRGAAGIHTPAATVTVVGNHRAGSVVVSLQARQDDFLGVV